MLTSARQRLRSSGELARWVRTFRTSLCCLVIDNNIIVCQVVFDIYIYITKKKEAETHCKWVNVGFDQEIGFESGRFHARNVNMTN